MVLRFYFKLKQLNYFSFSRKESLLFFGQYRDKVALSTHVGGDGGGLEELSEPFSLILQMVTLKL